jgi:glutamate-1-semialdehyde 2,1-aminomutase
MVFKRLFGREQPASPAPPETESEQEIEAEDDTTAEEDYAPEEVDQDYDAHWRSRAHDAITGGASTGSKRPEALYGPGTEFGPTHFVRAAGCRVMTPGGRSFIDCSMALGSVAIGYADEAVTRNVVAAAAAGNVCGLSHTSEVELAEKLIDLVPCAEQVRFLKSGGEAMAAAVRLARTLTGRDKVVGSGYFGWQDWSSTAKGVPLGTRADFVSVPFDDMEALERACAAAGDKLAAVVIEPVVEKLPSEEWMRAARARCEALGAVLIFDEMKTGFRLRTAGYQEFAKIEPDLAVFGKALANGFPLAAVVGRAAVMEAARDTWISSTLAGESIAIAAAYAVVDYHEKGDICETLWNTGEEMMASVKRAIEASGIDGVSVHGIPPMWFLRFDDPAQESRFLEYALERDVLFKRGPYNYASLAHDEEAVAAIEAAASDAFVTMMENDEA